MMHENTEEYRATHTSLQECLRQQDAELERLFDLPRGQVRCTKCLPLSSAQRFMSCVSTLQIRRVG